MFNSEYCEIYKSTYSEEHLRTAASENVFMKLTKIKELKKQVFSTSISETSENVCFYFRIGFFGMVRNKLQALKGTLLQI